MAEKNWLDEQSTVVPAAGGSDTSWLDGSSKVVSDATEEPSLLRSVGDSAIAFGSGVTQGIGMLANVAGADNPVSRGLDSATKALTDLESPYRKAEKQARAQKIADAEKSGSLLNEVGAYAGSFAEAPIDTTLNALGTSLPTLAAGFLPGGQAALAARAAQLGLGAAQGVGAVKGQIYDEVEKAWKGKGASPENAAARAAQAQSYTGDNAGMILAGGALGAAAGSTGAEGAVRRLVGREVAKDAAESSILKSAGMGALKESPMEMLQGGQERLASNIALQNEGFDQPTWQGVAGQAALEGLASAPMGAGFGALEVTARAPAQTAPDTPPAQPTVQPPVAGPTLALAGPDRGVIQVAGDGTARTPAYQAPGYVGDVTDVEAKTPRAQAADFASILDTDNVYSGWSNVQDGSDRATMRDQMAYVGRTYGGKTTPENAAQVASDLAQQFKWFRAASPEQQQAAIRTLMEPAAPVNPVREQVAAAAQQGGALSSAALTAIDTGLSDAMQPAPEQAPPQISLEEADARDRAAYEQFFAGFDADPVVSRYFENDDDIPDFDAASNASEEDFLRALGATDEDIQDAIATTRQPSSPQGSAPSNAGPQAYEPAGPREGAGEGAASQTGQVNAGAIQQAAPDAPVPGVGGPVGADGAGSAATAVSGASGPGGAGTGAATGSGAGATEVGSARAGGRGDSNQALNAPTNLRDALERVRQQKQEAANAQAAQAPVPAAAPVPGPAAAPAVEAAGPRLNIKAITAKQIPDMTDAELQAAIEHYGPAHKRTAKLQKEAQRRAAPSAITPTTTQGNADGPQASQAQQASPQPTQAAAAPAAAAGLTDGAPAENTGAQAAPAAGAQGAAPAEPEFTTIKTVYGDSVTVRTADLNGDKQRLRQYTKDGKSKAVPAIHRDNLDLTGDKRKASAKEDADNPFFNVITTKDGSTFASQAAASRELNRLAMGETHEVVAASEVQDGAQGFVIQRKLADAMNGRAEIGMNTAPAAALQQSQPQPAPATPMQQGQAEAKEATYNGTQVEAEQLNQYLTAEKDREEPAATQDADEQQSPQDFIPAPDGGLDYGEITPEMGKAMRRQAGKIRLQHGVQNSNGTGWGLVHIEANHGKQISGLGFGSVQDFVAHVASSIQQVWQVPGNSQLLLTLKDGRKDVMYIQLEIAKEGDFYRVNSAFPVRQEDYESLKGMKKIWDGSEPTSAVTGQRPAFATAASASPESESSQGSSNARGQDASVPPPTPEAQPVAAKQPTSEPKGAIQDFGQKIGGARKDVWSGFKDDLNSVGDDDIAAQPLAKVWPAPDYQKLIDAGMNAKSVAAVRALRDEVPAKPRAAWKVKRWAEQVKTLRGLANDVMDGKITVQDMERMGANKGAGLRGMMGRIELYELVGHGKSLEGVRFGLHHYTLYRGRENVDLWVVEKDSGASTFSNWPTEIATGDTKEQALAAFKEKYDSLDLQKAVRKASFDIFSERTSDGFFIGKKIDRNYAKLEGPFKTVKEAREYRQNNLPALETKLEKYKEIPRERADVNQPRVGVDMRNGQDVTPQMFSDVFGFRGVEFGNWVEQKRRQKDLNDAFDALMDMAAVLDIPTKAISLNGKLGLAFGARGSGGVNPAAAHYEPDSVVINLTKKEGAGSLGHEWWHALDNYFAKQRKVNRGSFMTTGTDVGLAARGKDYVYEGGIRQEMIDAFGAVVKAINLTAMKARASKLDSKRTKEYWTTGEEMSARAFESYLISKLQDQNASNDYLANVVSEKTWDAMAALGLENDGSYPYPTAAEIPAIRAGFDHFFQTVETRADDAGNVAMFSRVPPGLTAEEAVAMFNAANQVSPDARNAQRRISDARLVATQQLIDGIKEKWARAPEIIVARNMEDRQVPQEARDYDNKLRSQGSDGEARGFIYEGKVYLLSDELSGPAQIAEVLFHEVLGHYGLRGAFGDGLKPILQQIGTMRRRDVLAKAREYGMVAKGLSDADTWAAMSERDRLSAAEEVLAEMAQSTPEIGFVQRAIAAIRSWLRANVPGFKNFALTDDEIVRSYIIPARGFVNRSSETPQQALERAQVAFSRGDQDGGAPMFSRAGMADDVAKRVGAAVKSVTVTNIKERAGFKLTDYLGIGLQALGRRQIVDIYGDMLPLDEYNRLVQQMEADKNEGGAEADQLVTRWAKLPDEKKLADLMHDATLAQIDPAKPYVDGDDKARYMTLQGRFNALTDAAKQVYTDTRDSYQAHHAKVRSAIKERIERSEIKGERKAALLKQMDDEFFKAIKGVYFPLARFGQYAVTVKGPDGKVESVSRAETKAEAEALRSNLLAAFPRDKGFTVGRVMLSKDFIADRDAVGRGFMTELYQVLDKQDMDAAQRAELEDTLGQLYLSSLPDLSWAKHGIHRKGTPGFSQDARRAFAQNMFHGARYLAKLRYSDLMQDELTAMQKHVDDWREVEDFDQNSAQRVVDEMNKRHESLMNPKSNPLSTALTSLGFVFHLGLSPASAMVNLSQTALVAYPVMGAKWGFNKASAALLKASAEAAKGKNDITGSLNADELAAYNEAVRAGTIDVTMAHDLATKRRPPGSAGEAVEV